MKKLYLIGGTMGIGKTTVCQELKQRLPQSVFLDGDWCWDANPFQVTEETKTMVQDNICHLLNNFIHCSAYTTILFGWVMHEQSIIDGLLEQIDISNCEVICISLIANADTLRERFRLDIEKGIRSADAIEPSIQRLPFYERLNTIKIYTDGKTVNEITQEIEAL